MRRPPLALAIAIATTALLAACSGSTGPGWTYAPPTPKPAVTPAPSGDASPAPSAAPSAAPSTAASAAPSDNGGGGAARVEISALNIAYEQTEVSAPADAPFVIHFSNKDAGIVHNVEIKDASGISVFKGEIFPGVAEKDYTVPPLAAGTYQFVCSVHPNMIGTLKVGG